MICQDATISWMNIEYGETIQHLWMLYLSLEYLIFSIRNACEIEKAEVALTHSLWWYIQRRGAPSNGRRPVHGRRVKDVKGLLRAL